MGRDYDAGFAEDKQWARKYILDPLTAPEPSQETGPGTSFFNPRRSLSYRAKEPPPTIRNRRNSGYPTPPHSASPSRSSFHPSNPFSSSSSPSPRVQTRPPSLPPFDWAPASAILARKPSFESESSGEKPPTPRSPEGPLSARYLEKRPAADKPLPQRPQRHLSERYTLRVPEKLARRSLDQPSFEAQRQTPQTLVRRASERQPLRVPEKLAPQSPERRSPDWYQHHQNRNIGRSKTLRYPPQTHYTQGSAENFESLSVVSRSNSLTTSNLNKLNNSNNNNNNNNNPFSLQRSSSLSQRYHGDMSHRPLDMIKRENRAADRAPHLRRHKATVTDTIDSLDQSAIGGAYHHGGPYDATLASRNTNKLYSPVEAVKESNIEALKATPKEFINDSITKHVPLQGTAIVPPGMADMGGRVMNYEEGADLMREADAPGGAYRRWDFIPYHPDDLKGKGEPSFTVERDLQEGKRVIRKHRTSLSSGANDIELQPQSRHSSTHHHRKEGGVMVRQRSVSSAAAGPSYQPLSPVSPPMSPPAGGLSTTTDLRRSNTTGNRFAEGLKRRFGSLRRKRSTVAA